MSTAAKRYTPEDLLTMPDDGRRYELVNGELVEKPMGFESDRIGARVYFALERFCEQHSLGRAVGEATYQCFPDEPEKVRRPDASFISFTRFSADRPDPQGHCTIAPDLVAEVVSPHDLYSEIETKVNEYLNTGVRLVWVVDPPTRSVRIHRADGSVTDVGPGGELSGEDVLPGFRCPIAALFATRPA